MRPDTPGALSAVPPARRLGPRAPRPFRATCSGTEKRWICSPPVGRVEGYKRRLACQDSKAASLSGSRSRLLRTRPPAVGVALGVVTALFANGVFEPGHVRTFSGYPRYEPRREVYAGKRREVVDQGGDTYGLRDGCEGLVQGLLADLPAEGRDTKDAVSARVFGVAGELDDSFVLLAPPPIPSGTRPRTSSISSSAKCRHTSPLKCENSPVVLPNAEPENI